MALPNTYRGHAQEIGLEWNGGWCSVHFGQVGVVPRKDVANGKPVEPSPRHKIHNSCKYSLDKKYFEFDRSVYSIQLQIINTSQQVAQYLPIAGREL